VVGQTSRTACCAAWAPVPRGSRPRRWPDRRHRDRGSPHRRAARSGGRRRASICSSMGVAWPWSEPRLVTLTPTMARAASAGGGELDASGRAKPPSGIFMRASGSVVDTRGVASLAPLCFLIAATSGARRVRPRAARAAPDAPWSRRGEPCARGRSPRG
jgi:hypothetical protein